MERIQIGGRTAAGFSVGVGVLLSAEIEAVRTKLKEQRDTIGEAVNRCESHMLTHADRVTWWRLAASVDEYLAKEIAPILILPGVITPGDRTTQLAQGEEYLKKVNPWYARLRGMGCLNETTPELPTKPEPKQEPGDQLKDAAEKVAKVAAAIVVVAGVVYLLPVAVRLLPEKK